MIISRPAELQDGSTRELAAGTGRVVEDGTRRINMSVCCMRGLACLAWFTGSDLLGMTASRYDTG